MVEAPEFTPGKRGLQARGNESIFRKGFSPGGNLRIIEKPNAPPLVIPNASEESAFWWKPRTLVRGSGAFRPAEMRASFGEGFSPGGNLCARVARAQFL